jgi:hypothetical protein
MGYRSSLVWKYSIPQRLNTLTAHFVFQNLGIGYFYNKNISQMSEGKYNNNVYFCIQEGICYEN